MHYYHAPHSRSQEKDIWHEKRTSYESVHDTDPPLAVETYVLIFVAIEIARLRMGLLLLM